MTHIEIDIQDEQETTRVLALLNREHIPHRVEKSRLVTPVVMPQPRLSEQERAAARERIMQGAPTLNIDEMLAWHEESKKDRKLPFRDEDE